MKRILALGMSTVMALPVLSSVIVYAELADRSTTNTPASRSANTLAQQQTTVSQDPSVAANDTKALADRIQKRKLELKTRLTNAQKLRLQNKCKASQGLLSSVEGRIKGIETSRGVVYKNIVDRLTKLSEKLKNREADTSELDTSITTLQTKIDTFNTGLVTYKEAVSDLAKMDCKADPDGFKASLETARAAQQKTNEDAKAVRAYVKDTIKPLLTSIRSELADKKTEDNTGTTGGGQ